MLATSLSQICSKSSFPFRSTFYTEPCKNDENGNDSLSSVSRDSQAGSDQMTNAPCCLSHFLSAITFHCARFSTYGVQVNGLQPSWKSELNRSTLVFQFKAPIFRATKLGRRKASENETKRKKTMSKGNKSI